METFFDSKVSFIYDVFQTIQVRYVFKIQTAR